MIEKSDSYRSHKNTLMELAERYGEGDNSLKAYIEAGDLFGFISGMYWISWYALESMDNSSMFDWWFLTNLASFGYEVSRSIDKSIKQRKR